MQSSTASIAVTLSALYAGAVGLDQALALVIGQNIGTATSSAVAAIGASSTAKRLAAAYIAFKLIAALIAIALFPFVTPLIVRTAQTIDPTTLLAAYHTAYNVIGVAVLLPLMGPFTRLIERLVPERGSAFTKYLDPASLRSPMVAVEAVRRTIERALETLCVATATGLEGATESEPARPPSTTRRWLRRRTACARRADFCRKGTRRLPMKATPGSRAPCMRSIMQTGLPKRSTRWQDGCRDRRAGRAKGRRFVRAIDARRGRGRRESCGRRRTGRMRLMTNWLKRLPARRPHVAHVRERSANAARISSAPPRALADLRAAHRSATLDMVASGKVTASQAIARVDAVALMSRLAHHAWRAVAHLERAAAARMELEQ